MNKPLPARPSLDHLRRQAKSLLASLTQGEAQAIACFKEHLPAAAKMTPEQIRSAGFRLADAQSAIARKSGFAAWPQLARHVDQLRALEGTWNFARLEIDGESIPPAALTSSRILIDGDRFRTESPEGNYEGVFNIDVEKDPHHIDIEFVAGPEAGKTNLGLFRLTGDTVECCIDITGRSRPSAFTTSPESGHAYETLIRASAARPAEVTGGTAPISTGHTPPEPPDTSAFPCIPSETLTRLQGEWTASELVMDGKPMPSMMCKTGKREMKGNEVKITFGGMIIIHALVRLRETPGFTDVDYCNIGGKNNGTIQLGIMEWRSNDCAFCMAAPGNPRPTDLSCQPGSGHTLSVWRARK